MRRFFLPILIGGMAILMLLTGCNSSSCEKEQVDRTVENVKVVYYADFDEYSKTSNSTLTVGDAEALQDLFDLIVSCRDNAKVQQNLLVSRDIILPLRSAERNTLLLLM